MGQLGGVANLLRWRLAAPQVPCTGAVAGLGPAPNLKYYGGCEHVTRIVGLDPNRAMQQHARDSAQQVPGAADKLELVVGSAERVPLEDGSVDAVVATHVS